MSQYSGIILGDIPETCHKDSNYFYERFCFIDCRGPLEVHENAYFGFGVKIITLSHNTESWPLFGKLENKGVRILDGAWIGSFSILFNCTIGNHAIVSVGSVVNRMVVPDYGLVMGNPAKLIGYMYNGKVYPTTDIFENFGG